MTEYKRNIAVGLTAIIALAGLAYMIMLFGGTTFLGRGGYALRVYFPEAGALDVGSDVRLNGIRVGRVSHVRLRDDPRDGVVIESRIDEDRRIPANASAAITRTGLGAGGYLRLTTGGESANGQWLATDGSALLQGGVDAGGGLLGPQVMSRLDAITDAFDAFRKLAENLDRMIGAPATVEGPATGLGATISRVDNLLDSLDDIAGDAANQGNIRKTLAHMAKATAEATIAMTEVQQFAKAITKTSQSAEEQIGHLAVRLIDGSERLAVLFTTLNAAATALNTEEGSAGKLLNDPALYNNLLESAEMLNQTLAELQATIGQWRDAGVKIDLK